MKMNKNKIYLVVTLAILSSCSTKPVKPESSETERAPSSLQSFCESLTKLQDKTDSCDDNDQFVDSAEACLAKFEASMRKSGVKIATPDDSRRFDREGGADPSDQASTTSTENTTDHWIDIGNQAVSELKAYSENLVYPEEADDEDENGRDVEATASQDACYGETKNSIISVADDFQYYLEQLNDLKKSE